MARGMQQLRSLFQLQPYEPFIDTNDINDYLASIPPTREQQREDATLQGMDARASASIDRDLEEADAVRSARNLGFQGSYPLREQQEDTAMKKLQQLILPKQLEAQAAGMNLQATQEFNAGQKELDRNAMMERAQLTQGGQNTRQIERAADMAARSVKPGNNILRKLFGGLIPGVDTNEQVRDTEANRMRESVRSQMNTGMGGEETVAMMTPDGRRMPAVPMSKVAEFEALGATRMQ